jgi:heme oxygenase
MGLLRAGALVRPGHRYDELPPNPLPHGALLITALPERLRLETRDLHALSERSGVMGQLIGGRLGPDGYLALLRNLHAVYAALESALMRHPDEPALAVLGDPRFHREAALDHDLGVLCGPGWPTLLPAPAPATTVYVARLRALADTAPVLLAAHAYVRYLGDLHGGQMLKRLVARSLAANGAAAAGGAPADAAMRFYEFGSDDEVLALRQAFRAGLAGVAVDAVTADRLVAEARWAFEQHVALFNELAAALPPSALPAANPTALPAANASA